MADIWRVMGQTFTGVARSKTMWWTMGGV